MTVKKSNNSVKMLIDEVPRSFVKKNNSYSHCPLKKRPVTVVLSEEVPKTEIKGKLSSETKLRKFSTFVYKVVKITKTL